MYNVNGGPFLSVRSMTQALLEAGHFVVVIGSKDNRLQSEKPEPYNRLTGKFQQLVVKALNKYGLYNYHFTPSLTSEIIKNGPYDLIFLQGIWMWNCWRTFIYGKIRKTFVINSIRGEFNDKNSLSETKKKFIMPWIKFMLNRTNLIHVLNDAESVVLQNYGINAPIAVIQNGIYLPDNVQLKTVPPKQVLFLGRLDPLKNVLNLVKAWKKLKPVGWRLVIAGGGNKKYEDELKEMAGVSSNIIFVGPVDEIQKPDLFKNSAWFILPSFNEGMPMSVLEAASYGIPSIITEECNLQYLIESKAAIETKLEPATIAESLEIALGMSNFQWKEMSNNAIDCAKNKFSWKYVVEILNQKINSINPKYKL